jgi:hypothetical protein
MLVTIEHIIHRLAFEGLDLLTHMGNAPVRWQQAVTAVGTQLTAQQGKQARFAGTVGANQSRFLARMQGKLGTIEQTLRAALQGKILQSNHLIQSWAVGRRKVPNEK